eukprot:151094-Chlamydomonas_euryale.AAC.1
MADQVQNVHAAPEAPPELLAAFDAAETRRSNQRDAMVDVGLEAAAIKLPTRPPRRARGTVPAARLATGRMPAVAPNVDADAHAAS